MNKMIILDKTYYAESLPDLSEDICDAIDIADIETDEHGFQKGSFRVTIEWSEE